MSGSSGGSSSGGGSSAPRNRSPEFRDGRRAERFIAENTPSGTPIGDPVEARDSDDDDVLVYSLSGDARELFEIDSANGQLFTLAPLNYEDTAAHAVIVSVHDGKSSRGSVNDDEDDFIEVIIEVRNEEEPGRLILSTMAPFIDLLVTAELSDPDGNLRDVKWVWERSPDGETWASLEGVDGQSYPPSEDDIGRYLRVTTTYSDVHGPHNTVSMATTEVVVANTAPRFANGEQIEFVVLEHTGGASGGSIGEPLTAADRDGDRLTYSLTGEDAGLFVINPSTAQIMLAEDAHLDYELRASYSLRVHVLDGRDIHAVDDDATDDSIDVIITIKNVDEAGELTPSLTNPRIGAPYRVVLSDPDGQIADVEWTWERSPSLETGQQRWLPINSASSALYIPFAIDSGQYLRVSTAYSDGHGPFKSVQVVSAGPVINFVGPIFVGAVFVESTGFVVVSVEENSGVGVVVGAPVTAESGVGGVTYSLSGLDADLFTIDEDTGQIRVAGGSPLDYEAVSAPYSVTIVATDREKNNDSVALKIDLSDFALPGAADLYDINHDERIGRGEALSAIDDYFRGAITREEMLGIIGLYESA